MRNPNSITSNIPNFITSLNLFFGCMSIVLAFHDKLIWASVLIFAAGIFDFLDGLAARLLHAYSEFGKMLDSLADVVSFGVAPSSILFVILQKSGLETSELFSGTFLLSCSAFLIAVFSGLRLAKFNIDERQSTSFIGLPTPANAFLIASFPLIQLHNEAFSKLLLNPYILIPVIVILSLLLTSEIPMISLKFKNLSFKDNKSRFVLIVASVILLIVLQITAVPFIFILYLLISVIDNPQKKQAVTESK